VEKLEADTESEGEENGGSEEESGEETNLDLTNYYTIDEVERIIER